ncbi:MAG: hypothetical protein KC731_22010, partial [Myxococcales bacterium]|nr:hypothetical protein [Myxococcales bacterium]
ETVELEPDPHPITILIRFGDGPRDWGTGPQAECMKKAKTPEEMAACVGDDGGGGGSKGDTREARDINVRMGVEVAGYHDSLDVDVISPVASFGLESVVDGWGVGASVLADVVTAASPDIVATASPHWTELRMAPEIHGHVRFDPVDISLAGSLSREPDYLATTVSGGVAIDMADKNVNLALLYQYSHDIQGRTQTPFSVFSTQIDKHAGTVSLGLVLSKATFGQAAFTYVYEDGDSSKPYRHVPMFAPEIASKLEPGFSVDSVNLARLPSAPSSSCPPSACASRARC